ncbi:phage tail tube protein [Clostridium sp.]|jgi:hypothetical protein|uniref:phage tail tube protein n=1 Tax=Clostridium sp. TaxID=1506 RepID=UPI003EEB2D4D
MSDITNKILNGNSGQAWLEGSAIFSLSKIEVKITGDFSEINQCGDMGTSYSYNGWKGSGTVSVNKTESMGITQVSAGFKSGIIPIIKIITKLENKSSGKSERAAVYGFFSEFDLINFEAKADAKEEIPFTVTNYEVIETI